MLIKQRLTLSTHVQLLQRALISGISISDQRLRSSLPGLEALVDGDVSHDALVVGLVPIIGTLAHDRIP